MKRFWVLFFMFWPLLALYVCWVAPAYDWWFPGAAASPLGQRIDDLFYLILIITTVVFIGTQAALGYVLWTGAQRSDEGSEERAWFSHGSHNLEVIWTIVPAGVLLFIALYQMDVWAEYRIKTSFPEEVRNDPIAEVTARQFEWRIRYPGVDAEGNPLPLMPDPQPTDLYTVNDLHVPSGRPVMINLRTDDVQHSFFLPELRVKQDAVPGLVIPVWFEATKSGEYALLCAELCGWGHYKMKARLVAESETSWQTWLQELKAEQEFDGVVETSEEE
ncbi:Alternative cytochrome c oxidase subunit 2 [Maioricimonas rarisocia]|uniref:Cytochrome c oxidase subunit 2 n=1 Tax=Maioricimonas rarisocia TaxID=2528026 RepID=A0A517Z1T7_9PLAN|nr:cytochrome c oxidase subunit II [Maioricimonas rarisocia]QDU36447.1 Alternative cytochrome c oxidase subunit 2 [Maioricimonas rarisocia]